MNDKSIEYIADLGLDMLKRAVLLFLYEAYLQASEHSTIPPYLDLKKVSEGLDMPQHSGLILSILRHLEKDEEYVKNGRKGAWEITEAGIAVIKG